MKHNEKHKNCRKWNPGSQIRQEVDLKSWRRSLDEWTQRKPNISGPFDSPVVKEIEFIVYSMGPWLMGVMMIDCFHSAEYGTRLSLTPPLPPQQLTELQSPHLRAAS